MTILRNGYNIAKKNNKLLNEFFELPFINYRKTEENE